MSKDNWKKDALKTGVGIAAGVTLTDAYLQNADATAKRRGAEGEDFGLFIGLTRGFAKLLGLFWARPIAFLWFLIIGFVVVGAPIIVASRYVRYTAYTAMGQHMLPANPEPWIKRQLTYQERVTQSSYDGPGTEHTNLMVTMTNPTNVDLASFQVNCHIRHEMESETFVIVLNGGPVPAHSTRTYSTTDDSAGSGAVVSEHCMISDVTPMHEKWWTPLPRNN